MEEVEAPRSALLNRQSTDLLPQAVSVGARPHQVEPEQEVETHLHFSPASPNNQSSNAWRKARFLSSPQELQTLNVGLTSEPLADTKMIFAHT